MTVNLTAGSDRRVSGGADSLSLDIGLLALRVFFGGLLAVHGSQKLFGWFDGDGWQRTTAGFEKMGYNPGKLFGTLAGLCEFTGGALLLLGLLTPLGAAIALGTMINAMNVTWHGGLKGYEHALLFAVAAAALGFTGPGRFSLDHGRPWARRGVAWGIGAVALAVIAALLTLAAKWAF
ncbi:DoxX family protein [Nocardia pseudobrasiliensis]|uniref:Putative oxidoreductase n=1 Tax=Nocardia pseudobrasiliensis TaxID=45979 RepID=A0A370HWY1_9NOCA|nr:DoxX family protein [Nocardia pseudobrasiliensis]RDI62965.1 putative oxidoreductase [Nocardia pseudobrasiliensis]